MLTHRFALRLVILVLMLGFSFTGLRQGQAAFLIQTDATETPHLEPAQTTPEPTVETPTEAPTSPPEATATETLAPPTATTPPPTITDAPPTATATATITEETPEATATATRSGLRPVVVLSGYSTRPDLVVPGENFTLDVKLHNQGQVKAYNLIVNVVAGEFIPRETGGVLAISSLEPGDSKRIKQPLAASKELQGPVATLEVKVGYTDVDGIQYTESFLIALNIDRSLYYGPAQPTATPTPSTVKRAQLIISSYQADANPLQPGTQFKLGITLLNTGNETAKGVIMIVGGASVIPSGDDQGSSQGAGGVTASGGDFTNFSPLGVSNVQALGDLAAGEALTAEQPLIVNVTTNPGAYSFKISFAYRDKDGNLLIDDQVISLLVYSLPVVEINFYRDPGPLFVGQPNQIPLQITNIGRKSAVLGTLRVTGGDGEWMNNSLLVGPLESGGFFPLDAMFTPYTSGPVELTATIDYTDDFNQYQTITKMLTLQVEEAPVFEEPIDPGMEGTNGGDPFGEASGPENLWQKFVRFLKGMLGLDSSRQQPGMEEPPMPGMEEPKPGEVIPVPAGRAPKG